jgi:Protein of unknown function (DUF3106)
VKSRRRPFRRNAELAHRLPLLLLAFVAGLGFVALFGQWTNAPLTHSQSGPAVASAPNIGERSDAGWAALTLIQKQALAPFKTSWSTMSGDEQRRWLRTADRFQAMSKKAQRRAHERMEQWAQLTPQQRARARLAFQRATNKLSAKQRQDRWEAYRKLRPEQPPHALARLSLQPKAPASVKVEPGTTTVLMTQLFRTESVNHAFAQPEGDARAENAHTQSLPPTVDLHEGISLPASSATETTLPAPPTVP